MLLYSGLHTTILHNGVKLSEFDISSGIKQGCPLSAFVFATAVDPVMNVYLSRFMIATSRAGLLVDNAARVACDVSHL